MNERLIYTRSDVKALKSAYTRHARKRPPPSRRPAEREEHFKQQKDLKNELDQFVAKVYGEILKDSFSLPILLRKDRAHDHQIDWRYCLYEGIIYQFDRPGYSDEEMTRQIKALNTPLTG